jgi:hypothetical protein
MKSNNTKTALVLAAMLMLGGARSPALAGNLEPLEPNTINNETVPPNMQRGGTGIYDRYDIYRTPQGFPLPGWGQLRGMS